MNPWGFVAAAYLIGIGATAALLAASWHAMRRAERAADALRRR